MKKKQQVALALAIIIIVAAAVAYEFISAKPGTWHVVAPPLSNSGTQDTEEFTMDNMWRVKWVINMQNDPLFILEVYRKNDTGGYSWVTDVSATDVSAAQGILPVPYTGTFVMRVTTSNETEWTLLIEELNPT
jgi:hypothetical protein